MRFTLKIENVKGIDIRCESLNSVAFKMNLSFFAGLAPALTIQGKLLNVVDINNDDNTEKKVDWALIPTKNPDFYRKITVKIIVEAKLVNLAKKIYFPDYFVLKHIEFGKSMFCLEQFKTKFCPNEAPKTKYGTTGVADVNSCAWRKQKI